MQVARNVDICKPSILYLELFETVLKLDCSLLFPYSYFFHTLVSHIVTLSSKGPGTHMRRYIPNYHWSMYSHFLSPKFQATRTQCNPSRSPLHSLVIPLLQSLVLSYLSISSLDHICDGVGTKLPNTVDFCIVWHSCYRCPNHSNIFPFTFSDAVSSSPHSFLTLAIVMCLDHSLSAEIPRYF